MSDLEIEIVDTTDALDVVFDFLPERREKHAAKRCLQLARQYALAAMEGRKDVYPEREIAGTAVPKQDRPKLNLF